MLILRLLRYLRGYVVFRASGGFVERFLNLLARERVPVWDGKKSGGAFIGSTYASSYKKLRAPARKTGVKLRLARKAGLPFKKKKYRRRTGLLVGAAVFCAFLFGMSRFIWRVDVAGNEEVPAEEIIVALDELGVAPGRLRSSIDVRACERQALLRLDRLSWIALNITGSAVHVEVKEIVQPPPMVDPKDPCNIVAKKSGQIVSMMVLAGEGLRSVGDTVLAGDILVSGITEDMYGQNLFRHARAKIIARVQEQLVVSVPLEQTRMAETGRVAARDHLLIFSWDLPLFWPGKIPAPFQLAREETPLAVFGRELPIRFLQERYTLLREEPVVYTEDEAKLLALESLALRQQSEFQNAEIIGKTAVGKVENGEFVITADYTVLMDICEERHIIVSNAQ